MSSPESDLENQIVGLLGLLPSCHQRQNRRMAWPGLGLRGEINFRWKMLKSATSKAKASLRTVNMVKKLINSC